jgi:hypothetical protein
MTADGSVAEIWVKDLADGSCVVGFFNRSDAAVPVDYQWRYLGFGKGPAMRDLWLRQDLGRQDRFAAEIPAHGCALLKVSR